jgi:hypothetical protein
VSKKNRPSTELRTIGGTQTEELSEIIHVYVFDDKLVMRFDVHDAEDPEAVDNLLDSFVDGTVLVTNDVAAGQVILSIRGSYR